MRKDNHLLILAKQGLSKPVSRNPACGTTKYRSSQETASKGLTGAFRDYLTEIDVSSGETLQPDYQAHLDWYQEQDNDKEWIDSINERLF